MNRDKIIETATQVVHVAIAHRWMTVCSALREDHDYPELLRDIARALADAGMLARPVPTRDEVRRVLEHEFWPFLAHSPHNPETFWGQATDSVMALLKEQDS